MPSPPTEKHEHGEQADHADARSSRTHPPRWAGCGGSDLPFQDLLSACFGCLAGRSGLLQELGCFALQIRIEIFPFLRLLHQVFVGFIGGHQCLQRGVPPGRVNAGYAVGGDINRAVLETWVIAGAGVESKAHWLLCAPPLELVCLHPSHGTSTFQSGTRPVGGPGFPLLH